MIDYLSHKLYYDFDPPTLKMNCDVNVIYLGSLSFVQTQKILNIEGDIFCN